MDALLAEIPSMFAYITIKSSEQALLCTVVDDCGLEWLEEYVKTPLGLIILQGSLRTRFFYDPQEYTRYNFSIFDHPINPHESTKRIQPARGWCATVGRLCKLYPPTPASPEARSPSFWGKPAVRPRSMAGGASTPCGRH